MVQDWYDEFLDWIPEDYGNITKVIMPYKVYNTVAKFDLSIWGAVFLL